MWSLSVSVAVYRRRVTVDSADTNHTATLLYTAFGRQFSLGPHAKYDAQPEDRKQIAAFIKNKMPQLLIEGRITPNRVKLWQGGLHAVADGLQYMREGRVSGEKIVYYV